MEVLSRFRQRMNDILDSNSSISDKALIIKQLEQEAFSLCLSFDNQIRDRDKQIRDLYDGLLTKNNELITEIRQRFDLASELNTTKDSARTIIKCLSISLKSSCHVVARTIIEMITRQQLQSIYSATEQLMDRFRREKHYLVNNWTTIDLIKDARNRTFWKTIKIEEREDADLFVKWNAQTQKKNFIPTKDLLQRMWSRMKSTDVVTTLTHPKLGSFVEKYEHIEKGFINLYQTLSESVHNSNFLYADDMLPVPDINENTFSKADAIALANFYSTALPTMKYQIIASGIDLSHHASDWLNHVHFQNNLNVVTAMTTTECNETSLKRKLECEDQENEIQLNTVMANN